jgi:hypothetical protein
VVVQFPSWLDASKSFLALSISRSVQAIRSRRDGEGVWRVVSRGPKERGKLPKFGDQVRGNRDASSETLLGSSAVIHLK